MSECSHDCSSCSANCGSRTQEKTDFLEPLYRESKVKKVIGIVSGKGGVGKSFVTSMLACEMARRGYRVGVLDGDITGPSQTKAFGIHDKAMGDGKYIYPYITKNGIQVISTNMILDSDETPVIWRGPMVANILKQFYTDVVWGDLDVLLIDMPPGTGDVPLTIFQSVPLDGIVIVSSPQELVGMIVEKAVNMARMMNVPILGLVENMSYVECPDCGKQIKVFGESHIDEIAAEYDVPVLAKLPMDPALAAACDAGKIEYVENNYMKDAIEVLKKL